MKAALWRRWLALRFRLFQAHRHDRLVLEEICGRPLLVLPQVLNPALFATGEFLVQTLSPALIPQGSTVLDMGTGSGVGAVFAARWAERVVAVDINPEAVRCARINSLLHRVEASVDVLQGDLFEPVRGKTFDVVLFNPPYFQGEPETWLDRALRSSDVLARFLADLGNYLRPNGWALLVLSSAAELNSILRSVEAHHFSAEPVARRDLTSEKLVIFRLRPDA